MKIEMTGATDEAMRNLERVTKAMVDLKAAGIDADISVIGDLVSVTVLRGDAADDQPKKGKPWDRLNIGNMYDGKTVKSIIKEIEEASRGDAEIWAREIARRRAITSSAPITVKLDGFEPDKLYSGASIHRIIETMMATARHKCGGKGECL